jgi:hypothetical protein
MPALSIQPTYPIFTDIDGQPLEDGYIWIGTANLDPQTNPINVYWDAALTLLAAQPIRTLAGYPVNSGTPARLYVNGSNYSIRVMNKNGSTVYSSPTATERYSGALISFTGFKGQVGTIQDLADDDGSDWIGFEQAGSSVVARSAQDKMLDIVSVKDFGAVGDNTADDTAAIQAAIDSVAGQIGIYFPDGDYKITSKILVNKDRVMFCGNGNSSRINFVPTADGICFELDKGPGAVFSVVQCTLKDIAFYSTDTTYSKTALRLVDVSELIVDNVQTISPHWRGGASGSIFAHILSRDTSSFKNLNVFADRPIVISPDPDASIIGIDHFNFHNCYLGNVFGSAYPLIEIEEGVIVTQLTFTGYQAWVGGAGGFKWVDTTTAAACNQLTFENVRYESNNDPNNAYMIEINRSGAAGNLQNFSIVNGQTNLTKGFYLRRVLNANIENFWYNDSTREALNADSSVYPITTKNCSWQNGGTATLTGLTLVNADTNFVSGPVRENGVYIPTTSAIPQLENNATLASSYVSIAIDGVHKLGGPNQLGVVAIAVTTGNSALFAFKGAAGSVVIISDPDSAFTTTKNTGSKMNVYWDAGNNQYEIQNKLAGPIEVYVQRFGRS